MIFIFRQLATMLLRLKNIVTKPQAHTVINMVKSESRDLILK